MQRTSHSLPILHLAAASATLMCLLAQTEAAQHKIPSYIQICKRNDPHLEDCILDSVENLRPKLKEGIPELDVPGLDPLFLPVLDVSRGETYRAVGTNVTVRGASDFRVTKLKVDLKNTKFYIGIRIPFLTFDAVYDVNARILVVPLKGHGQIWANATDVIGDGYLKGHKVERGSDVIGDGYLKGHKVERDGDTYLDFTAFKMNLDISNYNVQLENLFSGNKQLGKAVNQALNDNKKIFMEALRPIVERVVSEVLLGIATNVTKNFTYDELFPIN